MVSHIFCELCFFPFFSRIIRLDNPPTILHLFMKGTHEEFTLFLVTKEYFQKVEAAVNETISKLGSKRIRIESNFPTPSDYAKSIQSKGGVCDHRSFSDLHVGLQVQAFGDFITSMKSEEVVDSKYSTVASTLMQKMSGTFESEKDRVSTFKGVVQELGPMFQFHTAEGSGYRTDGTVVQGNHPIANWEFTNEFFKNPTCPVSQNSAYFVHLQRGQKDRSPMLLVSVVGCHYFQVFGAVWNGDRCVCIDPLCSPISLLFVPRDPINGVSKLARLLSVIDKTMGELTKYYNKPVTERDADSRGPYWTDNGHLEYKGRLMTSVKWLFEATLDGKQKVVVKFVRSHYGEAAHRLLASDGFAPKLINCHSLPGGWYAVVMDKLEGHSITETTDVSDKVKQSLRKAVNLMHEKNYVHGDLRPQNMLIVDETVCILDFDWADTEGTATYPPELNMDSDCNWHPGVKPEGKILKEHDTYQITSICK